MSRSIVLDTRNVIIRTKLVVISHDAYSNMDTDLIVEQYGYFNLLADLIHYGGHYRDLPGDPHYSIVAEKLETLYKVEIDREYLDFVLAELEYSLYTLLGVSWVFLQVIYTEYPLIVARGGDNVYT